MKVRLLFAVFALPTAVRHGQTPHPDSAVRRVAAVFARYGSLDAPGFAVGKRITIDNLVHHTSVKRAYAGPDTLRAVDARTFRGAGLTVHFTADGSAPVFGFTVDNGRARGIEFVRVLPTVR